MVELSESFVKKAVIHNWLYSNGWTRRLKVGELAEPGVDIQVRHEKYGRDFLIEVKGESKKAKFPSSSREVAFVQALGQILSRMKYQGRNYFGVAFPETFRAKAIKRIPWQVAKKLLLYVFLVDKKGNVERLSWKELKVFQKQASK